MFHAFRLMNSYFSLTNFMFWCKLIEYNNYWGYRK
ncbi:hypothetical protein Enr17x_13850 [Gimesia fumaroli]|uniref:Uncharacterized protein n=1 Tax=Gimesia fumaroli TaxID=2527976 RepID=A0A518I8D9_9PLAN|nr:hypothetical protein Enr17x_13850 [Gimesia fumaroli]